MKLKVCIMAGGRGERFWPKSRESMPKQFVPIVSSQSMIEDTLSRFEGFVPVEDIYISTGAQYVAKVIELLPHFPSDNLIIEPIGRDTAACIALSTLSIDCEDDDLLFFIPADHYIGDVVSYQKTISKSIEAFKDWQGMLLLGIRPTYPSDGYGYIQVAESKGELTTVTGFREKPSVEMAKSYLEEGNYFWNAGMFFFKKAYILSEFERFVPKTLEKTKSYLAELVAHPSKASEVFASIEKLSFDYAVVEKMSNLKCLEVTFHWDDVGSWNALPRLSKVDENRNILKGEIFQDRSTDVIAINNSKLKLVLNNVSNLNIIVENDVIYITNKESEANIKSILMDIRRQAPELL